MKEKGTGNQQERFVFKNGDYFSDVDSIGRLFLLDGRDIGCPLMPILNVHHGCLDKWGVMFHKKIGVKSVVKGGTETAK